MDRRTTNDLGDEFATVVGRNERTIRKCSSVFSAIWSNREVSGDGDSLPSTILENVADDPWGRIRDSALPMSGAKSVGEGGRIRGRATARTSNDREY